MTETATPRAMLQPTKHVLRDTLRRAADKIEAQAAEIERLKARRWWKWWRA